MRLASCFHPMNPSFFLKAAAAALGVLAGSHSARAASTAIVTSVYSEVSNGYVRQKLPDGSFKREYYALARGQYSPGRDKDRSIDGVRFPDIAGMVAQVLARRNYFFAADKKSADLLLVIQWGTTVPFRNAQYGNAVMDLLGSMNGYREADRAAKAEAAQHGGSTQFANGTLLEQQVLKTVAREQMESDLITMLMFEDLRRDANADNARLLGYMKEINYRDDITRAAGAGVMFDDLITDIESERYYVIISAYDFRAVTQRQQSKLLWVTRVSIQARGNRFNERLKDMLAAACRYLGQDSGRLVRQYHRGEVSFGDLKFLGYQPAPAPAEPPAEKR